MKTSITITVLLAISFIVPRMVSAAPEDFVGEYYISYACDSHDPTHFIKDQTFRVAQVKSPTSGDYFIFEEPFDFGDAAFSDVKLKYVPGSIFHFTDECPKGPEVARENLKLSKKIQSSKQREFKGFVSRIEHLYGEVVLDGEVHEIYFFVRRNPSGSLRNYNLTFQTKGGSPVHNGRIH